MFTTIGLITYTIIWLCILFILLFLRKPVYGYSYSIITIVLFSILFTIMIVDNECIITGPCVVWGWIRFVLICLLIFLPIGISSIVETASASTVEKEKLE